MVSRARSLGDGPGELVDVSMLETLVLCLTYYPVTYVDMVGRPFRSGRSIFTPGVEATSDGLVGLGVGTGQQWLDFCVMVEHPEWMEDRSLFANRAHLRPDDRGVDGGAHDGGDPRRSPARSASRTHRSATARRSRRPTTSRRAGRSSRTRATASSSPTGRTGSTHRCSAPRSRPRGGRARRRPHAPDGDRTHAAGRPRRRCRSTACASSTSPSFWAGPAVHPRAGDARRRGPPRGVDGSARRHAPAGRPAVLGARLVGAGRGSSPASTPTRRASRSTSPANPVGSCSAGCSRPATSSSRTTRRGCWSRSGSTSTPSAPSDPTSSWCGCPASASTARGATTPPSPS